MNPKTEFTYKVGDNLTYAYPHGGVVHWYPLREYNIKAILSIPQRMPKELRVGPTFIGNTEVYVVPSDGKKHRVFAICSSCGKHVPAGRLAQHRKNTRYHA